MAWLMSPHPRCLLHARRCSSGCPCWSSWMQSRSPILPSWHSALKSRSTGQGGSHPITCTASSLESQIRSTDTSVIRQPPATLFTLGPYPSTSAIWTVNVTAGQTVYFDLQDSVNAQAQSRGLLVQPGTSTCLPNGTTSSASTTSEGKPRMPPGFIASAAVCSIIGLTIMAFVAVYTDRYCRRRRLRKEEESFGKGSETASSDGSGTEGSEESVGGAGSWTGIVSDASTAEQGMGVRGTHHNPSMLNGHDPRLAPLGPVAASRALPRIPPPAGVKGHSDAQAGSLPHETTPASSQSAWKTAILTARTPSNKEELLAAQQSKAAAGVTPAAPSSALSPVVGLAVPLRDEDAGRLLPPAYNPEWDQEPATPLTTTAQARPPVRRRASQ